jgi:phage terminase small subunit
MMVTTTQGKIRNPMLQEEREQAVLYDRLSQRMGLSPEARVRLNLMAVAGATLLGSLQKAQKEALDEEMPDVVDGEWVEVG